MQISGMRSVAVLTAVMPTSIPELRTLTLCTRTIATCQPGVMHLHFTNGIHGCQQKFAKPLKYHRSRGDMHLVT